MHPELIHDRGRGPEVVGTRITIYNLLPHFLDPDATEAYVCKLYDLTPEQVAAARAYTLIHAGTVLAEHLRIEARNAAGNPLEISERAERTREAFVKFKEWLDRNSLEGREDERVPSAAVDGSVRLPTFKEWFAEQQSTR